MITIGIESMGGGNTGDGVGRAWTGSHQYHAGLAGGTGVTVSHMGAACS
jgi:hypothetical protein